ncbi:Auxin-induced protein [Arachis hypogaea]|nr:Auxin-induced protein [Arachis hypogaea]
MVTKKMPKVLLEQPCAANETGLNSHTGPSASASAPASKAQVVGWPPNIY